MKKAIGNIRPFSEVNGTTKNLSHYDKWDNSITFVQYQSGAMGLNLQKADTIIYFSLPLSSELFEQSKKRIHRLGQQNKCTYYIFMCKNSVEQKIYDTLQERKDYTDKLFEKDFLC
jgi:SNF2 family DNA or RNA helicase